MLTTTTAIVTSTSIGHHQHQFTKNKLSTSGSFVVDSVNMSTPITTTMLTSHSYLPPMATCSKIPAINAHQQQSHYILQKSAPNTCFNNDIGMVEREHMCSSSSTVPQDESISSSCISTKRILTPLFTHKTTRTIPSDKINLRLILVSGKTKEFVFNATDSAGDISKTVFDNWPLDWSQEAVSKSEILRLIYQGRFLHCNVTLGALGLPLGKTTVMHLVPRDNLPEPNSQDQRLKSKSGSGRCCSTTCCIL
ncbi:uncharacterized protein LOC111597182 isoform X2 [Drosophila hydei]|uniref:Uncharacterized protein LOC111597182 isoform X2 n=1 Tax=Drosophila hydei TaxID=7224 RepID=A0A6J1LUH3_DROHY|nr:uncharacterized protein LOC111597182 isoform X2 [Drosophila hydei]